MSNEWEAQRYLVELRMPLEYKKWMENMDVVATDSARVAQKIMRLMQEEMR